MDSCNVPQAKAEKSTANSHQNGHRILHQLGGKIAKNTADKKSDSNSHRPRSVSDVSLHTFGHKSAVGQYRQIRSAQRQLLHRAALLHDLGKLRVPNSILDKPGRLDGAEWSVMQEHPVLTSAILHRVPQFRELASIAGAHHEKLDGSGYPNHLSAHELTLESRILAVSDVYGALTEDRPYRAGFTHEQAMAIMEKDAGLKLDADCFAALSTIVA
jgi:HD-GYP domain-containing protein (c-di-GMP phosphodiesterase class II)